MKLGNVLVVVLALVVALNAVNIYNNYKVSKAFDAYKLINQERGTIIVNESDGKKYVTFRLRANSGMGYGSPELRNALESLKDIGDIKGVSLDSIVLHSNTLDSLNSLDTLEKINLNNTYITGSEIEHWLDTWQQANPNKPRPILQ